MQKLLHKFSTELITNPFIYEEYDALPNFATGMVMPADEASRLLDAYHEGAVQMTEFVNNGLQQECLILESYSKSQSQNICKYGKETTSEGIY